MNNRRSVALLLGGAVVGALLAVAVTLLVIRALAPSETLEAVTAPDSDTNPQTTVAGSQLLEDRSFSRPLSGPCVLTGRVVDESGAAVASAMVALRVLDEPWPSADAPRTDTTTDQGQFVLRDLPNDLPYQVWAYATGRAAQATQDIRCGESTLLTLPPGGSVTVTIAASIDAPKDQPVEHAVLRVSGTDLWPTREAEVPVGEPVTIDGLSEGDYVIWAATNTAAGATTETVRLSAGENIKVSFALVASSPTGVRVLDAQTNAPIARAAAMASATSTDLIKRTALTDAQGTAALGPLPQGTITIAAFAPGYTPSEPREAIGGQNIEVRLTRGALIRGTVLDAEGNPLAGTVVSAETELGAGSALLPQGGGSLFQERIADAAAQGWPRMSWRSGALIAGPSQLPVPRVDQRSLQAEVSFITDKSGRFVLAGLPSGELALRARHPHQVLLKPYRLSLNPGEERGDVIVRLRPGCAAQVRTVDERGFPVPTAQVSAYDDDDTLLDRIVTGSDGYAQLTGLPPSFRLEAVAPGRVPRVSQNTARLGAQVELQLSLPPADEQLRGRVLDRNGFGIPQAEITARAVTYGLAHVLVGQSATDGTFVLPGAGNGVYHITADAGERGKAQVPTATSEELVKLVIDTSMADASPSPAPAAQGDIIIEPMQLREPSSFDDPLASAGRPSTMGKNTASLATFSTPSPGDSLPVTGPPPGRGGLPIGLGGKGSKVTITFVEPGSQVAAAGLAKGQKLRSIDGNPVRGTAQAKEAIGGAIGSVVMLEVEDSDGLFTVVVQRVRVAGP